MKLDERAPIGIAGAGRIGQALGRLLYERGEPVAAVASRRPDHAAAAAAFVGKGVAVVPYPRLAKVATRILLTVPDDAVIEVAAMLAESGMNRGAVLHTCGTRGPEALRPLAECGVSCAALHPLQTVATPEQGLTALQGITFALDGTGAAAQWGERIAALLGGRILRISSASRPLYHAAAAVASNCLVGVVDAAVSLMAAAGIGQEEALRALAPLVQASATNALTLGPENALTGPIQRGDVNTVASHLEALAAAPVSIREFYRAAGLHVLDLARRRGLDETKAQQLEQLMRETGKCNG